MPAVKGTVNCANHLLGQNAKPEPSFDNSVIAAVEKSGCIDRHDKQ